MNMGAAMAPAASDVICRHLSDFGRNVTDYDKIIDEVSRLADDPDYYQSMSRAVNPYGDGMGCERILSALQG